MKIVKATETHADNIGYIHAVSWCTVYKDIVPDEVLKNFTPENRSAIFKRNLPIRPEEYYVVYVEDKAAGMLVIGKSSDEDADDRNAEICAIYFLPEYWGKGYGKTLMDFAVYRLKELGFSQITLWVLEENTYARRFYERYGYIFDGTKKEINIGKLLVEVRYRMDLK